MFVYEPYGPPYDSYIFATFLLLELRHFLRLYSQLFLRLFSRLFPDIFRDLLIWRYRVAKSVHNIEYGYNSGGVNRKDDLIFQLACTCQDYIII